MEKREGLTWRKLLGELISDSREKQQIAEELGVEPITLSRWVSGESTPRTHNLQGLLNALPLHREQLLELIQSEKGFESFTLMAKEDVSKDIAPAFYTKVFMTRTSVSEDLRYWSLCELILPEALQQLDPDRLGMEVWVVRCMPPSGPCTQVRSLRESIGRGSPPWSNNLDQTAMFLGAESLTGNVVTLGRPAIIENLDEEYNLLPRMRREHEKSCAVFPILYAGRIAGAFLVSSTQYNYFLVQSRASLVQRYADLVAVAFNAEDFYDPRQISLHVMPHQDEQKTHFARFAQRVSDIIIEATKEYKPVTNIEADLIAWQQLENTLLQIPKSR